MSLPATRVSINDNTVSGRGQGGVFIALGSNSAFTDLKGQRLEGAGLFQSVLRALERAGIITLQKSSLWLSPAWPDPTRGDFYNAVIEIAPNELDAQALMRFLLEIDGMYGRVRSVKNSSRTLDLDLIDFRSLVCEAQLEGDLILPHPRMHTRSFVLSPLIEISPDWQHPVMKEKTKDLAEIAQNTWVTKKIGQF